MSEVIKFHAKIDTVAETGNTMLGREVIPAVHGINEWTPSQTELDLINLLNRPDAKKERYSLTYTLNNNTPNTSLAIPHERAVSAFYTYDHRNDTVLLEWGRIHPKSKEAKLHDYLRRQVNYWQRNAENLNLYSGHIAPLPDGKTYLALFDIMIQGGHVPEDLAVIINSFHASNIIPVTAEGTVQLPIFTFPKSNTRK